MNELLVINDQQTMSSLDVVELINNVRKEEGNNKDLSHSDFLKKVPEVIGESIAGNFSCYYIASNGKKNPCYKFPKRESMLMAMSYSYTTQARLYDRWQELENSKLTSQLSRKDLALMIIEESDRADRAELVIKQQQPLVNFANTVQSSNALIDLKDLAKLISDNVIIIGRNNLMKLLRSRGFLNLDNTPSQKSVNAGYMKAVETTWINPKNGEVELNVTSKVTGKGQLYFSNNVRKFLDSNRS